jgi:transposase
MGKATANDLRWRMVYAIWWDELDFASTAIKFSAGPMVLDPRTVEGVWNRFVETGDVLDHQGKRLAPPANQILDARADMELIDILISSPEATLQEHHSCFEAETGLSVHISTFCQAVRRLGFTRRKVTSKDVAMRHSTRLPLTLLPCLSGPLVPPPAPAVCPRSRRS